MNMTIKDLKDIIENLPDDMPVIMPAIDRDEPDKIFCFCHIRTIGVLSSDYDADALCLNTSDELNIHEQIKESKDIDDHIKCKQILL